MRDYDPASLDGGIFALSDAVGPRRRSRRHDVLKVETLLANAARGGRRPSQPRRPDETALRGPKRGEVIISGAFIRAVALQRPQ
jgi:hypothetical protein